MKTITTILLFALLAGLAATPATSQDGPLEVKPTKGPINPLGSALRPVGLTYRQEAGLGVSTRIRLGYTDVGLQVGFESEDYELLAEIGEDGADLSGEDVFIVDLWAPGTGKHLRVWASPLHNKTVEWIDESGNASLGDGSGITCQSMVFGNEVFGQPAQPNQKGLEAMGVEVVIPWELLETGKPEVGDVWKANFTRWDQTPEGKAVWSFAEEAGEIEFR